MIYFGDILYEDKPNALSINWEITTLCPYRCKYCDRQKNEIKLTFEDIQNTSRNLKKIYGDMFYQLCITGGEPTIRKDFTDVMNMFNDVFVNNRIVLLTNMFFTKSILEKKFINIRERNKIIYVGSLHLDSVRHIEEYFDKALYMNTLGFLKTEYKIIVPSWNIDKAKQAINILETKYPQLQPYIRVVRNFFESFELPKEFQKYTSLDNIIVYKNNDNKIKVMSFNEIKDLELNKTKNMYCMLGRQNLYIAIDGVIYGGLPTELCKSIPNFGLLKNNQTYYNILSFLQKEKIQCDMEKCEKECLLIIPKYSGD